MTVQRVTKAGITHPFGDARTVTQAFPAAIPTSESDPFLMCDYFDSEEKKGPAKHEDDFPVDWHPHKGFDIASYLKSGSGRHGDSMGNRGTFATPGMQWMSTGSGVEHAEGGANERGTKVQGFQIWINVPSDRKMEDPRYGTVPPEDMPTVDAAEGVLLRILAGEALGVKGPFKTVQPVQMIDFELKSDSKATFNVGAGLDTVIAYVYEGALEGLNGKEAIEGGSVILLDASDDDRRGLEMVAANHSGANVLLFAGKKLKEPVAWHGPIVMNTQNQIRDTIRDIQSGRFPPKRVAWNYKRFSESLGRK